MARLWTLAAAIVTLIGTWMLTATVMLQRGTGHLPSPPEWQLEKSSTVERGDGMDRRMELQRRPLSWVLDDDLRGPDAAATPIGGAEPPNRVFLIKFGHTEVALNVEEQCGLESALRAYAPAEVVILTTASFNTSTLAFLGPAYGARIRLLDLTDFVAILDRAGALPELVAWFDTDSWRSGYPLNNLSNGFRMALVYLFGGPYFDLDIVHVRAMPKENHTNVVVYQDNGSKLNNAVIRFAPRHPFLGAVIASFVKNFNASAWGANGPVRFTQTYTDECGAHPAAPRAPVSSAPAPAPQPYCATLSLLKRISYYPVHFGDVAEFYRPSPEVDELLRSDKVLGVHIWSAMSRSNITRMASESPLYKLAQRGCPATLERYGPDGFLTQRGRPGKQRPPADILQSAYRQRTTPVSAPRR